MSDKLMVYCCNTGSYMDIRGGETLGEIAARIDLPFEPICARVNNKTENLMYPVYVSKQVEFLPITHDSGHRTYIRTLCMILYRASETLYPGSRLVIEHSMSNGYYCQLTDSTGKIPMKPDVAALEAEMRRIVDADMPILFRERLTKDAIEIFRRQGLADKALLLETCHRLYTKYYELDGLSDSYFGVLAPRTGLIRVFELEPYKEGFLLRGFDMGDPSATPPRIVQEKMFRAFTDYVDFNKILGIRNVGELNRTLERGGAATLINVAEALHDKYLARISDEIRRRYDAGGARVVLIAGPSSSGKTTSTKRLAIQLITNLLKPQMISLDDYFIDRVHTPRDESGDYDYESLYALDLKQFNQDLNDIIAGKEVELPSYNFQRGEREYRGHKIKLEEGSILLIEGIHGLNPELTAQVEEKMKFRLYVSALTTLSIDDHNWVPTSDTRLIRRIIRDSRYRGVSADETIRRWASVRRGEEKWIFPFQENADAMFNSSLLFELSVLKPYGEEVLSRVPHDSPEYGEAYRLMKFLSYFQTLHDKTLPTTSLLREFLGGSSFHY